MSALAWDEIRAHNVEADAWIVVHGNGKFLLARLGGARLSRILRCG